MKSRSKLAAIIGALAITAVMALTGPAQGPGGRPGPQSDEKSNPARNPDASGQDVVLPDTPAGKTLGEFLKAFNSGKIEEMRRFHRERGGNEENADQDLNFFKQSGGLRVQSVTRSEQTEIEVEVQAVNDNARLSFTMIVDPQPPHQITEIKVTQL